MSKPLRVVFAEDGALIRAGVLAMLKASDVIDVVGVATDLPGLLDTVSTTRPDVVLTDIRMPPTLTDEGLQAAATLRRTHPELGVLVLTQHADAEYALELIAHGAEGRGYLLKERVAAGRELVNALMAVAEGGTVIDPVVVDLLMRAGSRRAGSPLERLTPRESEVLALVARGHANKLIAERLVVTDRAVEKHINSIFSKLDLPPTQEAHRRVAATLLYLNEVGLTGTAPARDGSHW